MTSDPRADIIAAARKLWGKETSRTAKEWRFGKKGSKSILFEGDDGRPVWFDNEADKGGGYVELCRQAGIATSYEGGNGVAPRVSTPVWIPQVPPPDNAPEPDIAELTCDTRFDYFDVNGNLLFYVKRFERGPGGRRMFYPLTYGTLNGATRWHSKAPAPPIPLYGLWLIKEVKPEVILLVEGEKAAKAANNKLATEGASWLALSWFGGARRAKDADLSSIASLPKIVIWPDADKAGLKARDDLLELLPQAQTVDTEGLPDGFDAADLKPQDKVTEFVLARVKAREEPAAEQPAPRQPISREEFLFISPQNNFVWEASREFWVATAIDKRFGKKTSTWIAKNRPVDQMTWAPGEPDIILDKIIIENTGWVARPGIRVFNQYRAPVPGNGDPAQAGKWLGHVKKLYPDDWQHILAWCAQRVQQPHVKINHALVIGGAPRIGKDAMLQPLMHAVGPGNYKEQSPQTVLSAFNGYAKAVVLRVNEARDLGESDRFKFHDHMKTLIAAPPDTIEINEKHRQQYHIPNVVGVVITTNHKTDGIYLPADDGRHYVAWSELSRETSFGNEEEYKAYFNDLFHWLETGGMEHASAYLRTHDLDGFNPKTPPPRTEAFWDIANANRAPEEAELADVIDRLGNPKALTFADLVAAATRAPVMTATLLWLEDRKNRRVMRHRMENCGYAAVPNPDAQDQQWKIGSSRVTVYACASLTLRDRIEEARKLVEAR